jgi:hypothetical protein
MTDELIYTNEHYFGRYFDLAYFDVLTDAEWVDDDELLLVEVDDDELLLVEVA